MRFDLDSGSPRIEWDSEPGWDYVIEGRDELTSGDWVTLGEVTAEGTTVIWTDPVPIEGDRFYRIRFAGEEIEETLSVGQLTHAGSGEGLLPNLDEVSFATARQGLQEMADSGEISLPIPFAGLEFFESIELPELQLFVDMTRRTLVLKAETTLLGQPAQILFMGVWENNTGPAAGFAFSVKFPEFKLVDWVTGLSGSVLDDFALDHSIITLATAALSLDLAVLPGNVDGFFGLQDLELRRGLNLSSEIDLATAPGLADPLDWLGFTDTIATLEGFLGINENALFQGSFVAATAPLLHLRAHLPISDSTAYPDWIEPTKRVLEFTNDPSLRLQLMDTLRVQWGDETAFFNAVAAIDAGGDLASVNLTGELAQPWDQPFEIRWLTMDDASIGISFDASGAGDASLNGSFLVGNSTVNAAFAVATGESGPIAEVTASATEIDLVDLLDLLGDMTGVTPFDDVLTEDTFVLREVSFSFNSGDASSLAISATTSILDEVETEVLVSFVETEDGTALLMLGLRVSDFTLSALYEGIDGTVAGDLRFPGVAFTIVHSLPDGLFEDLLDELPEEFDGELPEGPFEVSSEDLSDLAQKFYELEFPESSFTLELELGANFLGAFPQSRLPTVVLDALGMDPEAEVLLEGALNMRLGALAGGGLLALDTMRLKATLPPPTRPRTGFPDWLADIESGERILQFDYDDGQIEVTVIDSFGVMLDGAMRWFTSTLALATGGEQNQVTIAGEMHGGWDEPFGLDWLNLDTVGIEIVARSQTASATLHSSFGLGDKSIALEMNLSGGAGNRQFRVSGTVDALSLSDFTELAQKHLGPQASPFGQTTFDFSFTDVGLTVEAGSKSSFSLGARTELRGRTADVLFSATYLPGGGSPQIVTGIQIQDWSPADALEALEGTLVEELRLDTAALIFSTAEGEADASNMGPEAKAFYSKLYGTDDFKVPFSNGLSLIGRAPLDGNPINGGLDALGMTADSLFLSGTLPGSILGLGGSGLGGLALRASLPPVSPPGSPEWFVSGQLALQITSQPSVGLVGEITTLIEGEELTFSVGATFQRVGPNVEFALAGGLKAAEPWEQPFGIEWLIFNEARAVVAVNAIGSITLGFAGDMVIGEKDIAVAVATTISAAGVPTNFIFDGASEEGLEMADLVALQQAMAQVENPGEPLISLETVPEMAVRSLQLKFAPRAAPDLGVEAGFAIAGQLWLPTELDGPPNQNFAGIELSVGADGIIGLAHLGAFELGQLVWDDAIFDLSLSLAEQHLSISGAAEVGSLFQGDLDLGLTRTSFNFTTQTEIFEQFQAQLAAHASFSFTDPEFTVHALMQNDFNGAIVSDLTQRMKQRAGNSTSVADRMLRRGLSGSGWTTFRNNPHSLSFGSRIAGFASAAGWPTSQWKSYTDAIQDTMDDIAWYLPGSNHDYLDLALAGVTIPGVPGVITEHCDEWEWQGGLLDGQLVCVRTFYRCNGVRYGGGACWTTPPTTIGGVCHSYDIPCNSTAFIHQTLIPPLISRIDTILENLDRLPMIVIERAEFNASLEGLLSSPQVDLSVRTQFMQSSTRINVNAEWNFENRDTSLNALRDALANAL
ncbi:MAG: hypothetical protein JJU00_08980 [Opitutales bacterium]|nr:hypothetical protein [Opitutales bacterium]